MKHPSLAPLSAALLPRARAMRAAPTAPERILWHALRRSALGAKVRRQVPLGPFIADFYIPAARLVVELDGHTHTDAVRDAARDAWLAGRRTRTLRFSNHDVMRNLDGVLLAIAAALRDHDA